jgi:hypothetical protein
MPKLPKKPQPVADTPLKKKKKRGKKAKQVASRAKSY